MRIDGRDHFINRIGRWDDPVAQARAQSISAEIWRDYQQGTMDWSLCRYRPLVKGHDLDLLKGLEELMERKRQGRCTHAYRAVKRYGGGMRTEAEVAAFLKWMEAEGLAASTRALYFRLSTQILVISSPDLVLLLVVLISQTSP